MRTCENCKHFEKKGDNPAYCEMYDETLPRPIADGEWMLTAIAMMCGSLEYDTID